MADEGKNNFGKPKNNLSGKNNDQFSELDYRPRKKIGFISSAMVIGLILLLITAAVFVFSDSGFRVVTDNGAWEELNEVEEEKDFDDPENSTEEVVDEPVPEVEETEPEDVAEESENGIADSPDPDKLEPVLKKWLVERTADPEIILLSNEQLDNVDSFFEEYNLEEENIVVYQVESSDAEFATVVFGLPFSEWSIKAVFTWRDGNWVFLREEPVR